MNIPTQQVYSQLNWEDDDEVLAIHQRAWVRVNQLDDDYSQERHDIITQEETNHFVACNLQRADLYKRLWEQWTTASQIDPFISDANWHRLVQADCNAGYVGQYRSIARAIYQSYLG